MKELQALGMDVRVLREDNTEVEIMEMVDYSDNDYRYEIEGDRKDYDDYEKKSLGELGYQQQEFDEDGELVSAEEDDFDDFAEDAAFVGEDEEY